MKRLALVLISLLCSACSMNPSTTIKYTASNQPVANMCDYEIKNANTLTFTLVETTPTSSSKNESFVITVEEIGTKNFEVSTLISDTSFVISVNVNGVSKMSYEFLVKLKHDQNIASYSAYANTVATKFPNKTAGDTIILLALSYSPIHKNEMALITSYPQPFTSADLILDNSSINDLAYIELSFK